MLLGILQWYFLSITSIVPEPITLNAQTQIYLHIFHLLILTKFQQLQLIYRQLLLKFTEGRAQQVYRSQWADCLLIDIKVNVQRLCLSLNASLITKITVILVLFTGYTEYETDGYYKLS